MAVWPEHVVNTLGGGHLEHEAIARARQWWTTWHGQAEGSTRQCADGSHVQVQVQVQRVALGPGLGQCCGGVVELAFEPLSAPLAEAAERRLTGAERHVALFGGGHVGRAIVHVLGTLPLAVRWIDSRDEVFPDAVPTNVVCEHSNPVQAAVADLAPGSSALVMSFSHAEDLDVVIACLRRLRERDDLPFVGLIGSATKWATFRSRLRERGFADAEIARITCPIGLPGIQGKQPEVIAVAVAAQLLALEAAVVS